MRRLLTGILALVGWSTCVADVARADDPLPDKTLAAAVRAALHLEAKVELNDDALQNLYDLEVSGKEIRDLSGLEKCKNLALLKLTKSQVENLKPLEGLANLQSVDLSDNQISDLGPIAKLTNLQYLNLANNKIEKLDALKGLDHLMALDLSGNQVQDLGPCGGLKKLTSLYLARNPVRELAPLESLTHLSVLDLADNQVEDVGPLAKLTDLNLVVLQRNKIRDLGPLVTAAKADADGPKRFAPFLRLYLAGNPLSDSAKADQLSALKAAGVHVME
jgi:internalin A